MISDEVLEVVDCTAYVTMREGLLESETNRGGQNVRGNASTQRTVAPRIFFGIWEDGIGADVEGPGCAEYCRHLRLEPSFLGLPFISD